MANDRWGIAGMSVRKPLLNRLPGCSRLSIVSMPEQIQGSIAPDITLAPPVEGRVLLHSCCAPCTSAVLEAIVSNGLDVTVFFSNSNIVPLDEYKLRREELAKYCDGLGVPWVDDEYDHEDWLTRVAVGRENAPERGTRCMECFKYRLVRAACYASEHGFSTLTTTLASSRWKSLEQVDEAGRYACALTGTGGAAPVSWWNMNWRKGGLQPRRNYLIRELGFYNQAFCGCEFSHITMKETPKVMPEKMPKETPKETPKGNPAQQIY